MLSFLVVDIRIGNVVVAAASVAAIVVVIIAVVTVRMIVRVDERRDVETSLLRDTGYSYWY